MIECAKTVQKDYIHVRIAEVHILMNNLNNAVEHFNQALALNAHCDAAKLGLQRLDKLMKGEEEDLQDGADVAEDEEDEDEEAEEQEASDEMVTQD